MIKCSTTYNEVLLDMMRQVWWLTEVLRADPDGKVLLRLLRQSHAFHDLLHSCVVPVFQLHGAVRSIHAINSHLLVLKQTHTPLNLCRA